MSIFRNTLRFFRTIYYLKLSQIFYRFRNIIYRPNLTNLKKCQKYKLRSCNPVSFSQKSKKSILNDNAFYFLNREIQLELPDDWNRSDIPLLWMYNLHYNDGLLDIDTCKKIKKEHVMDWISGNKILGIGWEPYPLSLRISNWIKWIWLDKDNNNHEISTSLFQQASYLEKTLEYHLMGNHLLENAKALIFAGYFFGGIYGDRWLNLGIKILKKELLEQILNDGAHFELSPMYHSLMLELVLDVIQLSQEKTSPKVLSSESKDLINIADNMANWLMKMCHQDGDISFFNDASIGISQSPREILNRTKLFTGKSYTEVNINELMRASGFLRMTNNDSLLIMDVGDIGADYIPGHGHADALSIEFSLFNYRLIVNTGTSEYGHGARRDFERSTAAHSTLEINSVNSSEVWSGFRVGRRAKVKNITYLDDSTLSAEHDGYNFLPGKPMHKRIVTLNEKELVIEDIVSHISNKSLVRFHFHPQIKLFFSDKGKGTLEFPDGSIANWEASVENISVENNLYSKEFGKLISMKTIVIDQKRNTKTNFIIRWE